jgi:cobalt-zinc-cadmium efflux system outer membrane protein
MRVPRVNAAEKNLKAVEASELLKRHEIVARVKTRYYEYIRRVEELKAANEDLDLTRQIRDRIKLRYQVGETAKFELIRAETDLLNVQINTQAAKSRLDQAKAQLRLVVGTKNLPNQFEIKFQDIPKDNLPSLETLLAEVKAQNPEINRARLQLESNQSRLSLEKNTRLPQLAFKGQENKEPDFTNRSYGVVVTIPIWDWRIGQVREAAANVARSQNQLSYQTQLLETQLELAYEQYEISSYQVRTLENEVIQQATDARRIAEASFRFGERGLLEYLDAQRTLRAARADLIRAKFELASIIIEIERLRANPDNLLVKANP